MAFLEPNREATLVSFVLWAESQPLVRAAVLTSTLAVPGAQVDVFSDYDIILVLSEVEPFFASRTWLEDFGPLLALYRDPLLPQEGFLNSGYVVQYENGLKIDFSLWPAGYWQKITSGAHLPPELDAGYRILLDKDGLAERLPPPTYRAYIPTPPAESEYLEAIEVFFLEAVYVAKYLWRDDVVAAKFVLDTYMKHEHLRPVLEWHIETEHGWSVKPGPLGRGLKQWLRADLWEDLAATYTGAGLAENWAALDRMIALMRKAAEEVGRRLGYSYPEQLERRVLAYIEKVRGYR